MATLDNSPEIIDSEDRGRPLVRSVNVRSRAGLFLAGSLVWLALHGAGLLGSLAEMTFVVVGVATGVAVLWGVRSNLLDYPLPWYLMEGAFVVWIIGGGLRHQMATLGDLSESRALLPDVFSLTGYLLLVASVMLLVNRRIPSRSFSLDSGLDAVIVALAASVISWFTIVSPVFDRQDVPVEIEALLITYPALSVAVVTMVCRLGFSARTHSLPAFAALFAAMGALLVGDVIYMMVELGLWSPPTSLRDLPYAGAFVLVGAGALHPSIREISEPVALAHVPVGRWRIGLVALALLVSPMVLLAFGAEAFRDRVALGSMSVLLALAVLTRVVRALNAQAAVHEDLAHAASHDTLTGLPNRDLLQSHLGQTLMQAVSGRKLVAALFVDVDHFKVVNDGLGHRNGDQLLQTIAERIRRTLGPDDLLARAGGDEFVAVVLADRPEQVHRLAESIRGAFTVPFRINGSEVRVSVSIGVNLVSSSAPSTDWGTMIEDADAALYEAKRNGRDRIIIFDRTMRKEVDRRLQIEQELRKALETRSLEVHYQPLVSLPDGTYEGFEALVRWNHPELGFVSPAEFIPIAEETGLVNELGVFVLRTALGQLAEWHQSGLATDMKMSVNVSPRQMVDDHLATVIPAILAEMGIPATSVQLEITEGMLVNDPGRARELLDAFRSIGIKIALDDFGTGYSSLAHLKRFPVDVVKIDRSFVTNFGQEQRSSDESLVSAIVAMASALGLETLAEGVETPEQASRLFEIGVRSAQGWYYAKAMTADAALDELRLLVS